MSQYTEADIARIINDCEILILPDGTSIDEAGYSSEASNSVIQASSQKLSIVVEKTQEEEDFEQIYQASKLKKRAIKVRKLLKTEII